MAKISRPVIYVTVIAAVAYAAVLLTEPDKPTKKPTPRTTRSAPEAQKGFTKEDMDAKFARYAGKGKDAFLPKVTSERARLAEENVAAASGPTNGVWLLTGITDVNGTRSALVENGGTGDTLFLKVGDGWGGMRVARIESNAVLLANPNGKLMRLAFLESLDAGPTPGAVPPGALPGGALPGGLPPGGGRGVAAAPSLAPGVTPGVSPMPVVIMRPIPAAGSGGSGQSARQQQSAAQQGAGPGVSGAVAEDAEVLSEESGVAGVDAPTALTPRRLNEDRP